MVKKNDYLIIGAVVLILAFATGMINLGTPGSIAQPGGVGGAAASVCPTIVTQTLANASYDADKPATAVNAAVTVYLSAANGQLYSGALSTQQLGSYDVLYTLSSYFGTIVKTTTTCSSTAPVVGYLKAVDTPSVTAYNTDGTTALSTASNLSVAASGSATAHIKFAQGTTYKHLSGESGKFCIYINATNVTDWAPAQFSAVFNGVPCASAGTGLANSAQPTVLGGVLVTSFVCTGDFQPNDGTLYDLAVKYQAASGVDPGIELTSVAYVGADYSATAYDATSGKVGLGCVTSAGTAIQTLRSVAVPIK
jgi:hypothetical protein